MKAAKYDPKKTSVISQIKDLLSQAKSVAIIDFSGLKVSQATDLRRAIKKAGGQYLVAKNTLFTIAAYQSYHLEPSTYNLTGISGFVFSLTDEVSALKAVADFAKKSGFAGLSFKSGLFEGKLLTAIEVSELASIPDKKTLAARLVFNLNWNISQLVRTLDAIRSGESQKFSLDAKKEVTS